jgi:hypothetical protein
MSDVLDAVADHREREGWDAAVYLTEIPVLHDHEPVIADVSHERRAAAVSLPALGALRLRARAERVVAHLVVGLLEASTEDEDAATADSSPRVARLLGSTRRREPEDPAIDERLTGPVVSGRVRLLAGMVRTNHPARLLGGMAAAFAATVAASAFMIFNSSTWYIALTAAPWRLVGAAVACAVLMTAWIVVRHGLWEGRRRAQAETRIIRLYNLATLATIGQAVLALVVVTFAVDLGAVLFLISPGALANTVTATLRRPPVAADWLRIAALATVAATLAGAVGIALQRDEDIRNAAYGYRQREHLRGNPPARIADRSEDESDQG